MTLDLHLEWSPGGVRLQCGQGVGMYPDAQGALYGIAVLVNMVDEEVRFPATLCPTADHRLAEKLARGIEERLGVR